MVIGILNFGEGLLWLHYLVFCIVASLGALQIAAAHARMVGLMLLTPRLSGWLGLALGVGAYVWFFTIQPDLFIPGLAGGELFTLFLGGFVVALVLALALGILSNRLLAPAGFRPPPAREPLTLNDGLGAELWVPANPAPPLVLALREAATDSLDVLSRALVARGAAVLLCDHAAVQGAVEFAERNAERFHPVKWYVMGVGRGADRALALAAENEKFRAALALGPFGRTANARAGLRWLRETDYITALQLTLRGGGISRGAAALHARVVYGDEDTLVQPEAARELYPNAVLVAGARHFTLAAMPATLRLAADSFDLRAAIPANRTASLASPARGEAGE
jgi:hypothetical protein